MIILKQIANCLLWFVIAALILSLIFQKKISKKADLILRWVFAVILSLNLILSFF